LLSISGQQPVEISIKPLIDDFGIEVQEQSHEDCGWSPSSTGQRLSEQLASLVLTQASKLDTESDSRIFSGVDICQPAPLRETTHPLKGSRFKLPDALSRDPEIVADHLEGLSITFETEPPAENRRLPLRKVIE
jgi:hypothetical protein